MPIKYKDILAGDYCADFVVFDKIIVEIKAVGNLTSSHQAQTLNYLAATGYRLGLLINFGEELIKNGISRVVNGL